MRLPFEFILDFLHDAMKHNIDKIGRRQIVPQYFQLFLGSEDRATRRQYENILIEELVYGLKVIRDDYYKNEHDPLVVEIADDAELARFEVGVSVRMFHEGAEVQSFDVHTPADENPIKSEPNNVHDDKPANIYNDQEVSEPGVEDSSDLAATTGGEASEDEEQENKFHILVDDIKKVDKGNSDGVVDLAVNMSTSEDTDKDLIVETEPTDYDDSLYQDEEDLDPEVLERLKRDRKFYEEWKSRGRVPTLLSRNAARQSDRRMNHSD